jgi:hypothetical protein
MDNIIPASTIEVKINGTTPETTKASDVAEILKSIESMIEPCILRDHPEIKRENIVIGLIQVKSASLGLEFKSPANGTMISAFRTIGNAISTDNYSNLPLLSIEPLETLMSYARKWQRNADLIVNNGRPEVIATITPETVIEETGLLKGDTNLYGFVIRVGGVKPVVRIEAINGQTISCSGDMETIKTLGQRLYTRVGLAGTALWRPQTLEIRKFEIKSILSYQDTHLDEAFKELATVAEPYYANIHDVEEYLKKLRDDDTELE